MKWYLPACLLMIHGKKVKESQAILEQSLHIDSSYAAYLIKELLHENFMIEENGLFVASHHFNVFFDKSSSKVAYKNFLEDQMEQSRKFLNRNYSEGKFVSHLFTVKNKRQLEPFADILKSCLQSINVRSEQEDGNEVVVLNCQMHPIKF